MEILYTSAWQPPASHHPCLLLAIFNLQVYIHSLDLAKKRSVEIKADCGNT